MPSPASAPLSSRDYEFFYEGLRQQKLLVQCCRKCGAVRNPPGPMCPRCHALEWQPKICTGKGVLHSYTVHYHPPLPGFESPHTIFLAEMQEGFRLIGGASGVEATNIMIGMPVHVEFFQRDGLSTFRFKTGD